MKNIQHPVTGTVHRTSPEEPSPWPLCGVEKPYSYGWLKTDCTVTCGICLRILKPKGSMTDNAVHKEAKRRGFSYIGRRFEVFHPNKPKEIVRFELGYEATDYITFVAKDTGVVYASQLLVKKIVTDNPGGHINKNSFVQWTKPVRDIIPTVSLSFSVEI